MEESSSDSHLDDCFSEHKTAFKNVENVLKFLNSMYSDLNSAELSSEFLDETLFKFISYQNEFSIKRNILRDLKCRISDGMVDENDDVNLWFKKKFDMLMSKVDLEEKIETFKQSIKE